LLLAVAAILAVLPDEKLSVTQNLRFVVLVSMGSGVALLARWFWWRATAAAEIVALVTALGASLVIRAHEPPLPYAQKVLVTLGVTGLAWLATVLLFPPRDPARLVAFYRRARPPGFWGPVAALAPDVTSRPLEGWNDAAAGLMLVFGATLGIGGLLLGGVASGAAGLAAAAVGGGLLWRRWRAK